MFHFTTAQLQQDFTRLKRLKFKQISGDLRRKVFEFMHDRYMI